MKGLNPSNRQAFVAVSLVLSGVAHASQHAQHRTLLKRADNNWPIKTGYVAFGDSFGAGMGSGSTSGDVCRVGSNNFGDLLYKWTNNDQVDFQRKVCSGDTTVGLNRQIDEWKNPRKADVATISMGGNDLGFSDLVWYCVLTPNTAKLPSTTSQKCTGAMDKAKRLLDDMGNDGLQRKLKKAYKRVLDKSGRADFHIYVTGYPGFFNHDDPDCDKTTFHYWWAQYNPPWDPRIVLLKKALRKELNDLVDQLNNVIRAAVDDANRDHARGQVHFVDIGGKYREHRWCEAGDFHEPNPGRQDTWFFLTGWPDVAIGDSSTTNKGVDREQAEIKALIQAGSVQLPNPATCRAQLSSDPDPWELWKCRVAQDVAEEPNGDLAKDLRAANEEIAKGDVNGQHIPWYVPTRQIKTFHPRSLGMVAYRDGIIETINGVQVSTASGTCKFTIKEIWTCEPVEKNLYAEINLTGADGNVIYATQQSVHSPGVPINDAHPLALKKDGMSKQLTVIGEHTNDYIQFYYSSMSWTSGTTDGEANCKLNGADWNKNGPQGCPAPAITREFDCQYPC